MFQSYIARCSAIEVRGVSGAGMGASGRLIGGTDRVNPGPLAPMLSSLKLSNDGKAIFSIPTKLTNGTLFPAKTRSYPDAIED
jgi:hypothetical protein